MLEFVQMPEVFMAYGFDNVVSCRRYGQGHINDTFLLENGKNKYILQRINTNILTKPQEVMSNIVAVTEFLREIVRQRGGNISREVLTVVSTQEGEPCFVDSAQGCWRVYVYIENTITLMKVESSQDYVECARGFGSFFSQLQAFDATKLYETIPNFHNTAHRFDTFVNILKQDPCNRASAIEQDIQFVLDRQHICSYIMDKIAEGVLPLRATHNDTKLNNILLDSTTKKGLCIIDLDTIMPGSILYDFGDSIRSGATTAVEDERDLSKVSFDLHLYSLFLENYVDSCQGALTKAELDNLKWGALIITFECGMRFLTDYLDGDKYFKVHRDGHNLDRARNQFKLVSDMENVFHLM